MPESFENKLVMVCKQCKTAACWYGDIMCDEAHNADTCLKPVSELRDLSLEAPYNWSDERMEMIYGDPAPFGYVKSDEPEETGRWVCLEGDFCRLSACHGCQQAWPKLDDAVACTSPDDWKWPQDFECGWEHEDFPNAEECADRIDQ